MKSKIRYCYHNTSALADQIAELDYIPNSVGYAEDAVTWPFNPPFTTDPFYRIYLPLTGCFKLSTLDEDKIISHGSIYLVPSGQPLRFTGVTPCTHYWCHFYSERLGHMLHAPAIREIRLKSRNKYVKMFLRLLKLLDHTPSLIETMTMRNILGEIIALFLSYELTNTDITHTNDDTASRAAKFFEENFSSRISISELCRSFNMSESNFYKSFKARYGVSPRRFLSQTRLNAARKLLVTCKQKTAGQIADMCGFDNLPLFYRSFKKEFGSTPQTFRRQKY